MEEIRKDLFYAQKEKVAFWVAGYLDNSSEVHKIIQTLTKAVEVFLREVPVESTTVCTLFVTQSRRYQQTRVFYAKTETAPAKAFVLTDDWTMQKWLEN